MIKIVTNDNKEYTLPQEIAFRSGLIKNIVQDLDLSQNADEIPLTNVDSKTFEKIKKYMELHKANQELNKEPKTPKEPKAPQEQAQGSTGLYDRAPKENDRPIAPWEQEYVDKELKDEDTLYNIVLAANFMDIESLMTLCCKVIAESIKGKTVEEIREKFNLPAEEESDDSDED